MSILVIEEAAEAAEWARCLRAELPDTAIRVWPELPDPEAVEMAIVWDELEVLARLPRLRALVVLGAGVDHLLGRLDALPADLPCLRIVDDSIRAQMVEWVLLALLTHTRRWDEYRDLQRRGRYEELPVPVPSEIVVGILGFGLLGRATGEVLRGIGYRVRGWSRSRKQVEGMESFAGEDELGAFLSACDVVVCMLPLTARTEGLLGRDAFARMKRGAYFINAARGGHVIEDDLVAAIDEGRLSGATLDVQRKEPMPAGHPFWTHPGIRITPHVATYTLARFCAAQVADNYRRLQRGDALLHRVDLGRQY